MELFDEELVIDYFTWLKNNTKTKRLNNDWTEITTPFVNKSNDLIQIFVRKIENNNLQLSDAGDTISNLALAGYELNAERKHKLEKNILYGFGLNLQKSEELTLTCTAHEFPQRLHDMIQAILQVDDLSLQIKSRSENYFLEEVWSFFKQNKVYGSPNVRLAGLSTYSHKFDLLIPERESQPELSIKIVNRLKKDYLLNFEDVRKIRDIHGALIVNDELEPIKPKDITAYQNYDIGIYRWSERNNWIESLRSAA